MTSRDNPELKAEMDAIGESNRMTLKFRKPEAPAREATNRLMHRRSAHRARGPRPSHHHRAVA